VTKRVSQGGHDIPTNVIKRRYFRGMYNLIELYIPVCDTWLIFNNMDAKSDLIATGSNKLGEKYLIQIFGKAY
jgi:predicted ABC-type ATPase